MRCDSLISPLGGRWYWNECLPGDPGPPFSGHATECARRSAHLRPHAATHGTAEAVLLSRRRLLLAELLDHLLLRGPRLANSIENSPLPCVAERRSIE